MSEQLPTSKTPSIRTLAMPKDTNPSGDIFGGWLLSQMDIGSGLVAQERAKSRVATVAVDAMRFLKPVKVGDVVSIYATIAKEGKTSLTVDVEAWSLRRNHIEHEKVATGVFVFVCLDDKGNKRPIAPI